MLHMIVEAWPPGHEPRSDDIKVKAGVAGCWVACYSTFINRRRDMSSQFRAGAGESSDWVNPSSVDDARHHYYTNIHIFPVPARKVVD